MAALCILCLALASELLWELGVLLMQCTAGEHCKSGSGRSTADCSVPCYVLLWDVTYIQVCCASKLTKHRHSLANKVLNVRTAIVSTNMTASHQTCLTGQVHSSCTVHCCYTRPEVVPMQAVVDKACFSMNRGGTSNVTAASTWLSTDGCSLLCRLICRAGSHQAWSRR